MNYRCILFDYGGTLDAPGEHWSYIIHRAWQRAGADISEEEFRRIYVLAERALAEQGAVSPNDTFLSLMRKKIALENSFLTSSFPNDIVETVATDCYTFARRNIQAVIPTLRALAARIPLGIVSNFYGNLRAVLADMGVPDGLFTTITDSGIVGIRKPSPDIFLHALADINRADNSRQSGEAASCRPFPSIPGLTILPCETLVVGDSLTNDILPAASAGFLTAWLPSIPWDPSAPQPPLPADSEIINSITELQ